jgi:alpha-N-arabinofuranosidase
MLTAAEMTAHNTFDNPHAVVPQTFRDYQLKDNTIRTTLPAKSVVVLKID